MASVRHRESAGEERGAQGFSLLEVLMAMLILGVAITSILSLFAVGSSSYTRAADYSNMSMIAEAAYADITNVLRNGRMPRNIADQPMEGFPTYRYDATFEPLDAERLAYLLKLKVKWLSEGAERTEEFQTVILRR
ncbi:MAG: hypothetical protein A2Z34_12060 [Planctomycetes bacterium RBG_16_59_8]|nr:MAG: hypothetical protein A2Z34_12060 [Planctomycetes bacterium RBG_16_59_8]